MDGSAVDANNHSSDKLHTDLIVDPLHASSCISFFSSGCLDRNECNHINALNEQKETHTKAPYYDPSNLAIF